ncbi:MAG: ribosome biogenesis factor YjgA [Rhodocyclaceae bacterium]
MHELQELGERLVALPRSQFDRLDSLPAALRAAILEARRITRHEARRRQMQYIGRLMRGVDPLPLRSLLDAVQGRNNAAVAAQHEVEHLRTRVLEDEGTLREIAAAHPGADIARLRALRRSALRESAEHRPPRSFRELFRLLREMSDERR